MGVQSGYLYVYFFYFRLQHSGSFDFFKTTGWQTTANPGHSDKPSKGGALDKVRVCLFCCGCELNPGG
jgi:hypothetical protein